MICGNENNSIAVLNCFLSSLIYSILAFLTENINFWYIFIISLHFVLALINSFDFPNQMG